MTPLRLAIIVCILAATCAGCASPGPYEVGKAVGPIDWMPHWDFGLDDFIANQLQALSHSTNTQNAPPSSN